MAFREFFDFLEFMETSEVAGPGPNPREIEISFGADGPLACDRGPWARQEHLLPAVLQALCGIYASRLSRPSSTTRRPRRAPRRGAGGGLAALADRQRTGHDPAAPNGPFGGDLPCLTKI